MMETSDSEYFESADEDFHSEDEYDHRDDHKQKQKNKVETPSQNISKFTNLQGKNAAPSHLPDINKNRNEEINKPTDIELIKNVKLTTESIYPLTDNLGNVSEGLGDNNINNKESGIKQLGKGGLIKTPEDQLITKTSILTIKDEPPKSEIEENMWENDEWESIEEVKNETDDAKHTSIENNLQVSSTIKSTQRSNSSISNIDKNIDKTIINEPANDDKNCLNKNILCDKVVHKETVQQFDENLWNEEEGWGEDIEYSDKVLNKAKEKIKEVISGSKIKNETNGRKVKELERTVVEDAWDNDEWESIDEPKNQPLLATERNSSLNESWGSWTGWGVSSILSTASHSVSTLTNSVSQGINTVIETSIGVPDPEKLAKLNSLDEKVEIPVQNQGNIEEDCQNIMPLGFGFSNIGNLVSEVSKLVESTSTKVISGGLDTLETIGKKTMEVLQEGDPGLKKKRAFLKLDQNKPVLSQVLREAKEKAEQENKILQEKHFAKKMNYETLFDDYQGLVHLEALEILSKQCDIKLQTLMESSVGDVLAEFQETIDQVKELCELPDEDEDEQISTEEIKQRLKSAVEEIKIQITYDKLVTTWEDTECWLSNLKIEICDERELHQQAIETLAQLTALAVEQFHKAAELLLVKDHHSTADEADTLVQLTTTLTSLIGFVAAKFSDKLNAKLSDSLNKDNINSLITNVFFEAANSSSYIQDAFQLLMPILQVGAVDHS